MGSLLLFCVGGRYEEETDGDGWEVFGHNLSQVDRILIEEGRPKTHPFILSTDVALPWLYPVLERFREFIRECRDKH